MFDTRFIHTIFLGYGLSPQMFLNSDRIVGPSFDSTQRISHALELSAIITYVLSLATTTQETP